MISTSSLTVQCKVAQVVLIHESVEDVGAEDNGGRDVDLDTFKSVPDIVVVDEGVDESETAGLAAQGSRRRCARSCCPDRMILWRNR